MPMYYFLFADTSPVFYSWKLRALSVTTHRFKAKQLAASMHNDSHGRSRTSASGIGPGVGSVSDGSAASYVTPRPCQPRRDGQDGCSDSEPRHGDLRGWQRPAGRTDPAT